MGRRVSVARGVDLNGSRATIVEAKRRRGEAQFRSIEISPSKDAETIPCAAALPIHAGFIRRLTAPLSSIDKARRVLPALLDIELPFPLESCAHDFLRLARTPQGDVEALAVAARMEDIAAHLERLRAAGFNPVVLEHEAVALWRQSVKETPIAREQHRLLVYLGLDRIGLVAGSGHGLDAATGLRQGAGDLLATTGNQGGAQRLTLWWRTQRERAADADWHIAWCGPGAEQMETRRDFGAALFGDAELKNTTHRDPATFLARGLAAGLVSGNSDDGNFRKGALAHPNAEAYSQRQTRGRLVALVAGALALAALNLGWLQLLTRARDQWQQRLESEAKIIAGTDRLPRGQELLAAQRALEAQASGWAAFQRALEPGAEQILVQALRAAGERNLTFHNLVVRPQSLLLNGTAGDWNDGEQLAATFTATGWRVQVERSDAGADERVHFTLKGER